MKLPLCGSTIYHEMNGLSYRSTLWKTAFCHLHSNLGHLISQLLSLVPFLIEFVSDNEQESIACTYVHLWLLMVTDILRIRTFFRIHSIIIMLLWLIIPVETNYSLLSTKLHMFIVIIVICLSIDYYHMVTALYEYSLTLSMKHFIVYCYRVQFFSFV